MVTDRIATILPPREGFSPHRYGAVALCIRDFTLNSRYHDKTEVIGTLNDPGFDGIQYKSLSPRYRWYVTRTRAYAEACLHYFYGHPPALVEVHNRPALVLHMAKKARFPIALHLHNDPQEMKAAGSVSERQELLQNCAAIYCVSGYVRQRFLAGLKHGHEKVHVIFNGITLPRLNPNKKNHIIFVGRLTPEKGGLVFTQALRRVLPKIPEWKGIIVGSRRHEPSVSPTFYERRIAVVARKIGDGIIIEGFQDHEQVMKTLADATIAVVPSVWPEPFGRTALEAMASGCAVISSGTGGLLEVTNEAAVTLPRISARSLAEAIYELATNQEKRSALQIKAIERAQQFEIKAMTKTLDDIRETIINGSHAST